ncbi:MAG TPA: hypothetical protein IAA60_01845 [Candidatus Ornithomonoglobus intestinigallinarum]|uniref:Stage III sporulation protein AG n=1 Tax=Candidatus Ornithomonoglobus intestinigallinarum TaxID=2840894 RepID=A0A9D1H205_9FIRM|nr:hypothetical protein [Candidatus Ornithomonoglobus intestinigallinarum]
MNKEEALKFLRNKNNLMIIGVIIIGIIFMTAFQGSDGGREEKTEAVQTEDTERRLEEILSAIEGAGRVDVMITYRDAGEKSIAYEKRESGTGYDEKAVMADGSPLIVRETEPSVMGVIVTADGADSIAVKKALTEAVAAALGAEPHRICIYKRE